MTILAATDLSDRSRSAVRRAAREAEAHETGLIVLHAVATPQEKWEYLDETPPELENRVETAAQQHLEDFVEETLSAEARGRVEELRIEIDHPVTTILDASRAPQTELIVLGATGAGRVTQFLLGSTAEEVVRAADPPVLIVPAEEEYEEASSGEVEKVLAPIDLSDCSRASLEYAAHWARREEAELLIVHVTSLPTGAMTLMNEEPTDEDVETHRQFTSEQLRDFLETVDLGGVEHNDILRVGTPHREIERTIDEEDADLVVMGTHGRRGVQRLFLGSTAAKILRRLSIPTLTVRHRGEEEV